MDNENIHIIILIAIILIIWTIKPLKVFTQNSRVDWSVFGLGIAVPCVSNTVVRSSVVQPFVSSSRPANIVIESGFLVIPLLCGIIVGVNEQSGLLKTYSLSLSYLNPFNPCTTIRFKLPRRSSVELSVFNIFGQMVAKLLDKEQVAVDYNVVCNVTNDEGS